MRMRDADHHFLIRRVKSLLGCVEQRTICIIHDTHITSLGGLGFAQMSTRNGGASGAWFYIDFVHIQHGGQMANLKGDSGGSMFNSWAMTSKYAQCTFMIG